MQYKEGQWPKKGIILWVLVKKQKRVAGITCFAWGSGKNRVAVPASLGQNRGVGRTQTTAAAVWHLVQFRPTAVYVYYGILQRLSSTQGEQDRLQGYNLRCS